ncbi:MAG: group III truncated hemoglobin [Bergeyella sp.]
MKPLETRKDIELLVNNFYKKVEKDEAIGFFFTEIASVDWNLHLPKMYDFWETLLLGNSSYKGNPMTVHFGINHMSAIEPHHFQHWLKLWTETVQENFEGELAEQAIYKASNIANLMSFKMNTARKLKL